MSVAASMQTRYCPVFRGESHLARQISQSNVQVHITQCAQSRHFPFR